MEKSLQRSALLVTLSLFFSSIPVSLSVPFVLFHGFGGECSGDKDSNLTRLLSNLSGYPGSCVYRPNSFFFFLFHPNLAKWFTNVCLSVYVSSCREIGNGLGDSLLMPLTQQVSIACEKVKQMKELSEGYNIVGESQGNLVARGVIEFCDNAPPVINYVSLGGPHAGVAAIPEWCTSPFCMLLRAVFSVIYSDLAQDHTAPAGYVKIPTDIKNYLEHSKYLPKLNNERPGEKNSTFKDRFTSLQNLVLIMYQNDTVLIPRETSWFGYYPDGASTPVLPPQQTKLYTEDWIGLKTLDAPERVYVIF